jgi:hypothetical protein
MQFDDLLFYRAERRLHAHLPRAGLLREREMKGKQHTATGRRQKPPVQEHRASMVEIVVTAHLAMQHLGA